MDLESYYKQQRKRFRKVARMWAWAIGRCRECYSKKLKGGVAEHMLQVKFIEFKPVVRCKNCGKWLTD
jgi:hypothetical protein